MEYLEASTENCPVAMTLDVFGERWTLLIVRDALNGIRRFEDFRTHIGLSDTMLADRLRKLLAAGVLERRMYQDPGQRERSEYRITDKGLDLLPVVLALKQWGETHLGDPDHRVIEVQHRNCGGTVTVDVRCSVHSRTSLTARDTQIVAGPAAVAAEHPIVRRR